jgi:hypothetical protein
LPPCPPPHSEFHHPDSDYDVDSSAIGSGVCSCRIFECRNCGGYSNHTALAAALEHVKGTLENSLQAGEEIGKPISAKFALDDGSLQLSLWVAREDGFAEFILYPALRFVTEIYDFRDPDKLKVATAEKLAMDSATVSLLSATENAIKANHGLRAVSVYPVLAEGDPIAVVTLLDTNAVKIVTEKLY